MISLLRSRVQIDRGAIFDCLPDVLTPDHLANRLKPSWRLRECMRDGFTDVGAGTGDDRNLVL